MTTLKDLEDNLKKFIIQEQSDAHNIKTVNVTKYNNMKIWMDLGKYQEPHFFVRISISEAAFLLSDCTKLTGGLGYEERFVYKWFGRYGVKEKIKEVWLMIEKTRNDDAKHDIEAN